MKFNHGSLFSGIGGFDLAAEWMGWNNIFHCEWEEFPRKILKHHFPKSVSYGDIKETDFTIHRGNIDILTGGFPCQPYSQAGKRKGKEDERHLWPEMLRAIREIQPAWVVGENVLGIVNWNGGLVFDEVQTDLELKGTKYNRMYFQLRVSTLPIKDTEFGFLPTITTTDGREYPTKLEVGEIQKTESGFKYVRNKDGMSFGASVRELAKVGLLPTPREAAARGNASVDRGKGNLEDAIAGLLPTPMVDDNPSKNTGKRNQDGLQKRAYQTTGKTSQLNPLFVEEMMGFPENWTVLPFQNGETNQSKPTETQ